MATGQIHDRGIGLAPSLYAGPVCDDSAAEVAYAAIAALQPINELRLYLTFTFTFHCT